MKTNLFWLRLARPLTVVLGLVLSLWAVFNYFNDVQAYIQNPGLLIPDPEVWTADMIRVALNRLGLPGNFFAIYVLGSALIFVLVFLVCGWLTLLRKNLDWFGLYLTLLLLGWASGYGIFLPLHNASLETQQINTYVSWLLWPGMFFLLYFFPSGHVTPRWARWFAAAWGLFSLWGMVVTIFNRLPENFLVFFPLLVVVLLVGGYAQVYRYRHAGALERQQVKLVVTALLIMVGFFIFLASILNATGLADPHKSGPAGALAFEMILALGGNLTFLGVPVSIALAMLRFRLWDVDIIIRKTLVYSIFTALLVLVFFGTVTVLQGVFAAVSGQSSPVVVVLSTLAIAALFTPLRARVQEFIDRRFYRQKYDAEKALAAFAAAARSETDLAQLSARLTATVQETLQPEHTSLWLKPVVKAQQPDFGLQKDS